MSGYESAVRGLTTPSDSKGGGMAAPGTATPLEFRAHMGSRGFKEFQEESASGTAVVGWRKVCRDPACSGTRTELQELRMTADQFYNEQVLGMHLRSVFATDCGHRP